MSEAQNAIKRFDNSNIYGSRPIKVDLWLSKDELEQQKKAKENREVHQILNQIIKGVGNMGVGPQVGPGQQFQGGQPFPQGGVPGQFGGQYQQQFGAQRGGYNKGPRGGAPRGGRGGMGRGGMNQPMGMGGQFQGQPRMQYPPQMRQPYPQQFQGGMPPGQGMAPIVLPQVNMQEYHSQPDLESKKQYIGNHIYPSIEQVVGPNFAGKITGMLLDEKAVNIDNLLVDQAYLNSKVFEAHQLLL